MKNGTTLLLILLFTTIALFAQDKQYKVCAVGFYNFENLFDTINTPQKRDNDFTPTGSYNYNTKVYQHKLSALSKVVSEMGTEMTPDGVALLGVAEIENRSVLEDFAKQPKIAKRNYQIVHYESPDRRGIDVALLYNPTYFTVVQSKPLYVEMPFTGPDTSYTRDILWVFGYLDGDPVHVFVNHWPSRRGGAVASSPRRELAASVARGVIDSLTKADPDTKIILMGDLNDDPTNTSVQSVLKAKPTVEKTRRGDLYNPWHKNYKQGLGTLAWQDAWNLFDQIIVSSAWLDKSQDGYFYLKGEVFNKPYLYQKTGKFKGYPYRTYSYGKFQGGYSDHFPVFLYFVKEVK